MTDIIKAPFTQEQVQWLFIFQQSGMHPFTCCGHDGCTRGEDVNNGELIPITEGWVCPCGKYWQDWAHAFMADPKTIEDWNETLRQIKNQTSDKDETDPTGQVPI